MAGRKVGLLTGGRGKAIGAARASTATARRPAAPPHRISQHAPGHAGQEQRALARRRRANQLARASRRRNHNNNRNRNRGR